MDRKWLAVVLAVAAVAGALALAPAAHAQASDLAAQVSASADAAWPVDLAAGNGNGPGAGEHRVGPVQAFGILSVVAEKLGMSRDELVAELKAGKVVKDLADARGVALDDIVDAILAPHAARLDRAVERGRITREQADGRLATMREHLTQRLSEPFDPDHWAECGGDCGGGPGSGGGCPGGRGGRGPGGGGQP